MNPKRYPMPWVILLSFGILTLIPILYAQPARSVTAAANELAENRSAPGIVRLQDAPGLEVAPESIQATTMVGEAITRTLIMTNTGTTGINFKLSASHNPGLRIVSGNNWRVTDEYTVGWEALNFNDSAWECSIAPAPVNCEYEHCWSDPDVYTMWSEEQSIGIYLRKTFFIQDVSSVLHATILTRSDDDHDLYINGTLVASDWDGLAGPILVTDISMVLHTGVNVIAVMANDTFGGCRHMCVDAVIELRPTTPDWLMLEPNAGALPANASVSVQIVLDSSGLRPGVYPATLDVLGDDPRLPRILVPVTLTVTAQIQNRYLPMAIKE